MGKFTIIGTSHIAAESVREIKKFIDENKPDIVAVELDKKRFIALLAKKLGEKNKKGKSMYNIRRIGVKGYLFVLLAAWGTKKLADLIGAKPGQDMMTAIALAKRHNLQLALIDQDIDITLQRFSKYLSWREGWHFIVDIFRAIFFRKREMEKLGIKHLDLRKVPPNELIKKLIMRVKVRYPNIYKVLVHERNVYMTRVLRLIIEKNPEKDVLAVVGAGHEDYLKKSVVVAKKA